MKTTSLIVTVLFTAVPAAMAGPYFGRPAGEGTPQMETQRGEWVQLDQDRALEYVGGGRWFVNYTFSPGGTVTSTLTTLPAPDTDPYPANFPVDFMWGHGATGDLDNDGDIDIVYSCMLRYSGNEEPENIRIVACLNDGNGNFTRQWQLKDTSAAVTYTPEVKLADFDNDGDPDLAETSNGLKIRWNDGTGAFTTATANIYNAYPSMPGFSTTPHMEVADFDGNGWLDIGLFANIRLQSNDNRYTVTGRLTRLNNTNGAFTASIVQTNAVEKEFFGCAQGDLNGDGRVDLLAVKQRADGGDDMVWHRNNGAGFDAAVTLLSLPDEPGIRRVPMLTVDLDEDGLLDIVYCQRAQEMKWLRGTGNGAFSAAAVLPTGITGVDGLAWSIALGDGDGDGDLDLLCDRGATIVQNIAPHLKSGASVATFAGTALSGAVDLTTGDLNNDGRADLIAADGGGKVIRWYTAALGALTEQSFVSTGATTPLGVTAGDWNGDSRTDVAWSGADQLRQALSNNAGGTSWSITTAATMTGITGLEAADMDGDKDVDILSYASSGVVRIHANNGTATTWLPQGVDTGITGISRMALQSVAGRRPEIAALAATLVTTWRHNGNVWAETAVAYPSPGTASRGLCIADITATLPGAETIFSLNSNHLYYWNTGLSIPVSITQMTSPVVQLTTVDWNADSYTDLLVTTSDGVTLLQHNRSDLNSYTQSSHLLFTATAGTTLQDIAVLDVNADGLPDAVAADSAGKLHVLRNTSRTVEYSITPAPAAGAVPGSSPRIYGVHGGYTNDFPLDTAAVPGSLNISFNRAVGTPGADVAGTPMTDAEVNALVDYVTIRAASPYGPDSVTNITPVSLGGGQFRIATSAAFRSAGSLGYYDGERDYTVHVHLKSTALSAPVTRFFVLVPTISWTAVDPWGGTSEGLLRSHLEATSQRVLVYVRQAGLLDDWRQDNFGTYDAFGSAANDADPDGDGVPNLIEYVTSQNPNARGGPNAGPAVSVFYDASRNVMAPELRLPATYDSRVKLTLQYAQNPGFWQPLSTRTGTGSWTGISPYINETLSGLRRRFAFDGGFNTEIWPRVFFRLKAEEVP